MTEILSPKPISKSFRKDEMTANDNLTLVNPVTRSTCGAPNTKNAGRAAATPNSAQKKQNAAMSLAGLFVMGSDDCVNNNGATDEKEEANAAPVLDTITEVVTLSESNSGSFESSFDLMSNNVNNNLGVDMDYAANFNDKRKVEEISYEFNDPMMNYIDPAPVQLATTGSIVPQQHHQQQYNSNIMSEPRKKSRRSPHNALPDPLAQHQRQRQPTPPSLANVSTVSTPQKVANILASQLPRTTVPPGVPMPQLPGLPQYLPPSSGKTSFEQLMQATTMASPVPAAHGQPIYARTLPTQWSAHQAASIPYLNGNIPQHQQQQQAEPPSRKEKSLGVLCQSFMDLYKDSPPNRDDNGAVVEIVEVADHLGVKRRRIYDIINILESIDIVARVKKNTYRWHGTGDLPIFFAKLQRDAIEEQTRKANGTWVVDLNKPKAKGMATTCQKLLQIFLATGQLNFSLAYAADIIMGPAAQAVEEAAKAAAAAQSATLNYPVPLPDPLALPALPVDPLDPPALDVASMNPDNDDDGGDDTAGADTATNGKTPVQKAMKSKVRRMYDIANVLQALGIIEKYNVGSTNESNKPSLRWTFYLKPDEIARYHPTEGEHRV